MGGGWDLPQEGFPNLEMSLADASEFFPCLERNH